LCGTLAILAVIAAVPLTWLLPPLQQSPYALFFAAIVVSAWLGGWWAGLLATLLSVLALDFFFLPPRYELGLDKAEAVRVCAFLLGGVLIGMFQAARQHLETTLRQRDRRKGDFLAFIAHELRNFLTPVASAVRVLRTATAQDDTAQRCLQIVERQIGNMSRLVSDLLDVARLEQGKLGLCKESVDLTALTWDVVESVRPFIESRGHKLTVAVPPASLHLQADKMRLTQVLMNLLTNAAKYTDEGGRIALTVEQDQANALLRVRDTGAGLRPEHQQAIFDPFVQVGDGTPDGLGIGLSLVRGLARLHGGDVSVSSDGPGQGSEFVVRLPLQECFGSS
jgi:signal transduction histidine kinase